MKPGGLFLVILVFIFMLAGCGEGDFSGGAGAPEANAGGDQVVETGSTVTLDGSGSTDGEDEELTYSWDFVSLPAGSSAVLSNTDAVSPTFTADVSGTYEVGLVVSDGDRESEEDIVKILATYKPVANAGSDRTVAVNTAVELDGSGSTDQDEDDTLTFEWTLEDSPSGSNAAILNSTAEIATFTPDTAGDYVISLVVSDGHLDSEADTVTITAQ